jgi:hypothetical protein
MSALEDEVCAHVWRNQKASVPLAAASAIEVISVEVETESDTESDTIITL